jgi:peroxiredoxin Q/BCP
MRIGDIAPDFSLSDQHGNVHTLSELCATGPVVLFFYPAAMTAGCTKEACSFRDNAQAFQQFGAQRVGISMDDVAKQTEFSNQHGFDYPLLSDTSGTVAASYGVKRAIGLLKVKRTTFVINPDHTIRAIIHSEINMNAHVERAIEALKN